MEDELTVPFKIWFPCLILLILAGAAVWFFFFYENDEVKIRKQLDQVVLLAEKKGEMSVIAAAGASKRLEQFFTSDANVEIQYNHGKVMAQPIKPLLSMLFMHKNSIRSLSIRTSDIRITFPDLEHTEAVMTFSADAVLKNSAGEAFREVRSVTAKLKKDPETGDWLFCEIRAEEVVTL